MYYQLKFNRQHFQSIVIDVDELFEQMGEYFGLLDGSSIVNRWKAPHAMFSSPGDSKSTFRPGISDWLGQPVLSPRAFELLQSQLESCAELLPIHCDDALWYIVNITKIENIVDRDRSERQFINGELRAVNQLVFTGDHAATSSIFKTDYDERKAIFCDDTIKQSIENEGLSGWSFEPVAMSGAQVSVPFGTAIASS